MTERVLGPKESARRRRTLLLPALLALVVGLAIGVPAAVAAHFEASLEGSNFEIDFDANLVNDSSGMYEDWADIEHGDLTDPELRRNDAPTGRDDDSYAGGAKEDDACPGVTTGSIPNNKSDLLAFGVYEEPGDPGFLNLFWQRVTEPSGTTLMDFELNQSGEACANGVNRIRTEGDILIEYKIEQGGATADIVVRTWDGSAWGDEVDVTDQGDAAGTINDTAISSADSDGLGAMDARTFGEAQIDLDFIFDSDKCTSFGSAFLKSRASDSFTSQLKDYIAPVPISLTNCGQVIIRKQTDPDGATGSFGFTKAFGTDPATGNTFSLSDDGVKTFTNVLFGMGYTVVEDDVEDGFDFKGVDCSASTGVTPSITGATVTFAIDDEDDILDCTYTNEARGSIVVEKVTSDGSGAFGFTSGTLSPAAFTLTTTAAGAGGKDSRSFADLAPGTYDVAETVPAGWNLDTATCDDGSDPASIGLSGGETVTCTFTNSREKGAILITKTRKFASATTGAPADQPHPDVTFTITGGELAAGGITVQTGANGTACVTGLVLSSFVGAYTVTETLPEGYTSDDLSDTVSVTAESADCTGSPAAATFHNEPLTDVLVQVEAQDPGATKSSIECVDADEASIGDSGDMEDPAELDIDDLEEGTYVCTIVIDP